MKKLKKIQLLEAGPLPESPQVALAAPEESPEAEEETVAFPQISKWLEKINIKPFPWKKINAKNALIAGCLVIIAVAGYLNIRYGSASGTTPPLDEPSGNEVQEGEANQDFFASAVIDRERVRGEALEVLVGITEDDSASEVAKSDAFTQMERIANETSWEIDIENLIKAKGFQECVAIINEDTANVVVKSDGLTAGEIAQIKEIIYLEASIEPKDIHIIEKAD